MHRINFPIQKRAALAALFSGLLAVALMLPQGATTAGVVVVRGAASGSTLRLSVEGNRLHVNGLLARGVQQGCRVLHRAEATCSLRGIGSVELRMGPSGDMVEVLDKLPVPLTTYLGAGSDKL